MALIELEPLELTDIARAYGKTYQTKIGEVAYTKLVNPSGFVLLSKDDTLRFYLYRKLLGETLAEKKKTDGSAEDVVEPRKGVWELVWGASSIVHDGLPISEELMQWRLKYAMRSGKQGFDEAEALGRAALDAAAEIGTGVHKAIEALLNGKEVTLAGRNSREVEHIGSAANFINDHEIRNPLNEQIVAFDKVINGVRVVYAGTTDWIVEIKNTKGKWETWLLDFKTSAEAHLSHKLQALAYKEAAEVSLDIKIDKVGILLLGRATKSGYNLVEVGVERGYRLSFDDFVLVYRTVMLVNKGKLPQPSYKTYPKSIKLTPKKEESKNVDSNNSNSDSGSAAGGGNRTAPSGQVVGPPTDVATVISAAAERTEAANPDNGVGKKAIGTFTRRPAEPDAPAKPAGDQGTPSSNSDRGQVSQGAKTPETKLPSAKT